MCSSSRKGRDSGWGDWTLQSTVLGARLGLHPVVAVSSVGSSALNHI